MSFLRPCVLAAALACLPAAASTNQPPDVPKHKCGVAPERPGQAVGQDRMVRQRFERELKEYQECIKAYVAERNAVAKANHEAANQTIEEYNSAMKALNEARK